MAPGALMGLMEEWQHSMGEIPGYDTESWEHLLNQSQPQQPPQRGFAAPMLEAVEGITRGSVDASRLPQLVVDSESNEGIVTTTAGSTSPARSRHGDADPVTSSRKRKKDRPAPDDPKQGERGKRSKGGEVRKAKDRSSSENSGDSGSGGRKPQQQEYSKQDYIHVRARRGQATDSHSLAERVRREKMSERMKFLQDLVPGCRKVTGKAVMLDEIINYVQSLQRQVESLSMKLASVSPAQQQSTASTHWTLESLMSNKEIQFSSNNNSNNLLAATSNVPFGMMQQQQQAPSPPVVVQQQQAGVLLPFGFNNVQQHAIRNTSTTAPPPIAASLADLRSFDTNIPQFTGRDGELQCVVQHMGLHNRSFAGQFHCQLPLGHMKVEF